MNTQRTLCAALREYLADGDRILAKGHVEESDEALYADMNARFRELIVREARSQMIEQALERIARIPSVGPQALAFDGIEPRPDVRIERGESARVEALVREHANPVKDSLNLPGITDFSHPATRPWRSSVDRCGRSPEVRAAVGQPSYLAMDYQAT